MVDPGHAALFLIALGVCLVPRIGMIAMVILSLPMARVSNVNFFLVAIVAALVGAGLRCLPGMAMGGLIGILRRNGLPISSDAVPEPARLPLGVALLPAIGGAALRYGKFAYFNPRLFSLVAKKWTKAKGRLP